MEVESEFPLSMVIGTVVLLIVCFGAGWYLWKNKDRYFGDVKTTPLSSTVEPGTPIDTTPSTTVASNTNTPPKVKPTPPIAPIDEGVIMDQLEKALIPIEKSWRTKDLSEAIKQLEKIKIPRELGASDWRNIHLGRLYLLLGRKDDASKVLKILKGKNTSTEVFRNGIVPGKYPLFLSFILAGDYRDKEEELKKHIERLNASWMEAYIHFDQGVFEKGEGSLSKITKHWDDYLSVAQSVGKNAPYVFKSYVEEFKKESEVFAKLNDEIKLAGGPADDDKIEMYHQRLDAVKSSFHNDIIKDSFDRLKGRVDNGIKELNERKRLAKEEREKEANANRQVQLEAEKNMFKPIEASKPALLVEYKYEELLKNLENLNIQTDESKKILEKQLTFAKILKDFKSTIGSDVLVSPYAEKVLTKENRPMIGKLSEVKDGKLWFREDAVEIARPWADFPPVELLKIGHYYLGREISRPVPDKPEIARRAIALALFSREYRGLLPKAFAETEKVYLKTVKETGVDVDAQLKMLFQ